MQSAHKGLHREKEESASEELFQLPATQELYAGASKSAGGARWSLREFSKGCHAQGRGGGRAGESLQPQAEGRKGEAPGAPDRGEEGCGHEKRGTERYNERDQEMERQRADGMR